MFSKSATISNWAVHLMQCLDFSKTMYHDRFEVTGDLSSYTMTIQKLPVATVKWSPPGLDYSTSMYHNHSSGRRPAFSGHPQALIILTPCTMTILK